MTSGSSRAVGWLVVGSSWVGLLFHFGSLLVNTFGIFLTAVCAEYGWTRTEVSLAFTFAMGTAMVSMPLAGWVTDRYGSRWLILASTAVFGLAIASLAGLDGRYWQLVATFLLLGLVGPGTSAIPHASLITRHKFRRSGLALGIAMSGTAVGGIFWPPAGQYLLDTYGLHTSYYLLGAGVLFLAVPAMALFLRESIEAMPAGPVVAPALGLSRMEALRSPIFLILGVSFVVFMAAVQATMIHLPPMLTDRGMTADRAAQVVSLLGLAGILGRVGSGYLLDLISTVTVPVAAFLLVASGIFLLATGVTGLPAAAATLLVGLGYGAEAASIPWLIRRYFGTRAFGQIYSYLFVAVPVGGALGPVLMGFGYDRWGSYRFILLFWGTLTLFAAGLLLRLATHDHRKIDRPEGGTTHGVDQDDTI